MSNTSINIKKINYGETEMSGPRHVYRQGLVINFVLSSVEKTGKVLDIGCGDGCVSLKLAKKGFKVFAVDESIKFINMVRNIPEKRDESK